MGIFGGVVVIVLLISIWVNLNHHKHDYKECYGGIYADEEGGPRTLHEIWWECKTCPHILDEPAKRRAEWAERNNVVAIIPTKVIYADRE